MFSGKTFLILVWPLKFLSYSCWFYLCCNQPEFARIQKIFFLKIRKKLRKFREICTLDKKRSVVWSAPLSSAELACHNFQVKVVLNVNACWGLSVVGISIFFLITPQPTNWCPIGHGLGPGNMQHHQTAKKLKRFQHSWKIVTCTEKESIFWITVQQLMVLSCGWWGLRSLINDDLKVYTLKSDHRLLHKRN